MAGAKPITPQFGFYRALCMAGAKPQSPSPLSWWLNLYASTPAYTDSSIPLAYRFNSLARVSDFFDRIPHHGVPGPDLPIQSGHTEHSTRTA